MELSHYFPERLRARFQQALPGADAQNRMTVRGRVSLDQYLRQNPNYRSSAVLLPIFQADGIWQTVLIERPSNQGIHSGQLALPGGAVEPDDHSLMHTALREAEEEVGLPQNLPDIIGSLTPLYIPPSNFLVHPFVALLPKRFNWQPNADEVNALFEIPLHHFMDPYFKDHRRITIKENSFVDTPCYMINEKPLWGATAMMFSELEEMLKEIMDEE